MPPEKPKWGWRTGPDLSAWAGRFSFATDPFCQAGLLLAASVGFMLVSPDLAWSLAYVSLILLAMICPLSAVLQAAWLRTALRANLAVLFFWPAVFISAALLAQGELGPQGGVFRFPALLYAYCWFVMVGLRLLVEGFRKIGLGRKTEKIEGDAPN